MSIFRPALMGLRFRPNATATDADAQAFLTAAGIGDATIVSAIDNLVISLKNNSIWTKMYAIYPMVGGTASTHKWNLKDPRDLDAAYRLVFSGTWTHASTGATPSSSYADTKLNISSSVTGWITNNHLSFYSRTTTGSGDGWNMGVGNTSTGNPIFGLAVRRASANTDQFAYDSGNVSTGRLSTTSTNAGGLSAGSCRSATDRELYKNGASVLTSTTSDTAAAANGNIYLGTMNPTAGSFFYSNHQCAFASIGQGLTDTEMSNLYTAVNSFQTTLGRNV